MKIIYISISLFFIALMLLIGVAIYDTNNNKNNVYIVNKDIPLIDYNDGNNSFYNRKNHLKYMFKKGEKVILLNVKKIDGKEYVRIKENTVARTTRYAYTEKQNIRKEE